MNPPIPAVVEDTGRDLDDTADQPLDRALDLFTLHVELTEQVKQVVSQKPHFEPGLVQIGPGLDKKGDRADKNS